MEHGVKRTRPLTGQEAATKRQQEAAKIAEYQRVSQPLLELNRKGDYAPQHLELSARLVDLNAEMPTAWAFRRELPNVLKDDLKFTLNALRRNPKTYAVWEHRKWVLQHFPEPERTTLYRHELALVDGFLKADARNFHGWDYRRHVLRCCPQASDLQKEIDFTTSKISASFSNFSAWHYRAQCLAVKLQQADEDGVKALLDQDFDLVRQALYTDPADQSGWLYHRLLLSYCPAADLSASLETEIKLIEELAELEEGDPTTSRWALDALVAYRRWFAQCLETTDPERARQLRQTAKEGCEKLEALDPVRAPRYRHLKRQ